MAKLPARRLTAGLLTSATIALALPAAAPARSHAAAEHHHHAAPEKKSKAKPAHHEASRHEPAHQDKKTPSGATTIPAGGLKVYCPSKSPLLVRKSTQGNGTTVTVICR